MRFCDIALDTSKFDLTLTVQETAAVLTAKAEYNRDLFDRDTIARLLEHFENLLTGIVSNPRQRLSELPMLSEPERQQLLVDWNQTATEYPRDRTVSELFEEHAARTPEAVAVTFDERSLTYQELNQRANRLARWLRKESVGPDVLAAVRLERSADMIVAMLAVLKSGGAYVPLDPSYPKDRLDFMLSDSQAPVLLTTQALMDRLPQNMARVFCLDSDWNQLTAEDSANLSPLANSDHLACVIYTSGSTGEPKGVAVPHRAVNRLVRNTNYIQFKRDDRVGQVSNVSFDAATFEIWGALLNGARLVGITTDIALSPREFAREIREQRISVLFLTCSLFNQVAAEAPGAFATVDTVMFGGEAADPNAVRAVLADRPPRRLVNGYGPTENTTFSVCHEVRSLPSNATSVPIGCPISNTQCFVLDPHRNPVPVGVTGELHLGGDGLARGYWNRPQMTAERFVPNPFGGAPISKSARSENPRLAPQNALTPSLSHPMGEGGRRPGEGPRPDRPTEDIKHSRLLYRTGDLVRWRADGTLEFLGRLDNQVKLRGYRIELGEIEAVLRQHECLRDCVVVARRKEAGGKQLAAYCVSRTGPARSTPAPCGVFSGGSCRNTWFRRRLCCSNICRSRLTGKWIAMPCRRRRRSAPHWNRVMSGRGIRWNPNWPKSGSACLRSAPLASKTGSLNWAGIRCWRSNSFRKSKRNSDVICNWRPSSRRRPSSNWPPFFAMKSARPARSQKVRWWNFNPADRCRRCFWFTARAGACFGVTRICPAHWAPTGRCMD